MPPPRLTAADLEEARRRLGLGGVAARPPARPIAIQPASSGGLGFLGGAADAFRGFVPQGVRDVAGKGLQATFSGERALNLLPGSPGTAIRSGLERIPKVGGALSTGFDIAAAPATFIPGGALFGFGKVGARGALAIAGREAAAGVGAVALATGSSKALTAAEAAGVPIHPAIKTGIPLTAGLIGGIRLNRIGRPVRLPDAELIGEQAAETANKLIRVLDNAKLVEKGQRQARTKVLESRVGVFEENLSKLRKAPEDLTADDVRRARGDALSGELPRGILSEFDETFNNSDWRAMHDAIENFTPWEHKLLTRTNMSLGLDELMTKRALPQRHVIVGLEQVFGEGFAKSLLAKLPRSERFMNELLDYTGIPRAIQTSMDMSALLRQGFLFSTSKEFWKSVRPSMDAWRSERGAVLAMDDMRHSMSSDEIVRMERHMPEGIQDVSVLSKFDSGEEVFRSRAASEIPIFGSLIRKSDRAYQVFLNKLRSDTFRNISNKMVEAGATADDLYSLGFQVMAFTGRGPLPGSEGIKTLLSTGMFAPRLLTGRIVSLLTAPKIVAEAATGARVGASGVRRLTPAQRELQRELARRVVTAVAVPATGLALLKLSGLADVELNPKSSDFGKARMGAIRIDPWGGFQQIARYTWQMATGDAKSIGSGDVRPVSSWDKGVDFLNSKLAPLPGAMVDMMRGRSFMGGELEFEASPELNDVFTTRSIPLILQDIIDGIREEGAVGALIGLPVFFGVGAQSFRTKGQLENELAQRELGKSWDELSGTEAQAIEATYAGEFQRVRLQTELRTILDEIDEESRAKERDIAAGYDVGLDPAALTEQLSIVNRTRIDKKNQALRSAGVTFQNEDSDVVDKIFKLRKDATNHGILDFQLLDQLTDNALAGLGADARRLWEQRRRFTHDPSVVDVFHAKDYISDEGYWDIQREAFERFSSLIRRRDPNIQTMQQLEQAIRVAEQAGDRGRARSLNGIKTRIDKVTRENRLTARRRDSLLDLALRKVYGLKPIR